MGTNRGRDLEVATNPTSVGPTNYIKAGGQGISIALVIHSLDPTLQLDMKIVVVSIILSAAVSVNGVAQEYMRWGLPEGATMRIGRGMMRDLAYSPDGSRLAIASSIGIWLYDAATLEEVALISHHVRIANSFEISLNDAETLEEGALIRQHAGEMLSVAYSPDGSLLAGGSENGRMRLWDATTGEPKHPSIWIGSDVVSVEFSRDGMALASAGGNQAQIWDAKTFEKRHTFIGHTQEVTSIAFSPDGNVLVTGSKDQTVRVWDAKTGKQVRMLYAHTRSVTSVAFSSDGKTLASTGDDATLRLWDTNTWELRRILTDERTKMTSVAFTPDGKGVVVGCAGKMILWDAETGSILRRFAGHSGSVFSLVFSPDGTVFASGSDDMTVRLWDVKSGSLVRSLDGFEKDFGKAAFHPDGRTLAIGGSPHIRLWDTSSGEHLRTLGGHQDNVLSLAFSPDGSTLASSSKTELWLWDARTGIHLHTLTGHKGPAYCLVFNPDGETLASGGWWRKDYTVRLWDTGTGENLHTHSLHTQVVRSLAFSPNGKALASASSDGTVVLWDTGAGTHLRTLVGHSYGVGGVAFSQNGGTLCGVNHREARLWDTVTWEYAVVPIEYGRGHSDPVFNRDGSIFAIGNSSELELWNAVTGERVQKFLGYSGRLWGLAISPGGRKLAAVSKNETAVIWDIIPPPAANATVRVVPSTVASPPVGEHLTFSLDIESEYDVSGYGATLYFDSTALRYVKTSAGDFPSESGFSVPPAVDGDFLTLEATAPDGASRGDGTLATVTFEVVAVKGSMVTFSEASLADANAKRAFPRVEDARIIVPPRVVYDVNNDGVVNTSDLAEVEANFMKIGENAADVNNDGVVDVLDLVRITGQLEGERRESDR